MSLLTVARARIGHLRNQQMTRPAFLRKRERLWRRFARFIHDRSPYYNEVMERAGLDPATCRPDQFPVLTKGEVIERFDDIVTDRAINREVVTRFLDRSRDPSELLHDRYFVMHTSGSSGEVGIYVYSKDDFFRGYTKAMRSQRTTLKKRRVAFLGATRGHFAGSSMMSSVNISPVRFFWDSRLVDINDPVEEIVAQMNAFQPSTIVSYVTGLCVLAERQRSGELRISPESLITSAEPLSAGQRELIRSTFGVEPVNNYATTEHLHMGSSMSGDGMVLFEDDLIFEMHDDHTCVTNLFNRTLPLVRYRMDDVFEVLEEGSSTSPLLKVKDVVGRSEHVPTFVNAQGQEDFINPIVIVEIFVKGLRRFQFQIVDDASFRFKVVPAPGLGEAGRAAMLADVDRRLREILSEKRLDNVRFSVEEVSDLPIDPGTGKFKLIVPAPTEETGAPHPERVPNG